MSLEITPENASALDEHLQVRQGRARVRLLTAQKLRQAITQAEGMFCEQGFQLGDIPAGSRCELYVQTNPSGFSTVYATDWAEIELREDGNWHLTRYKRIQQDAATQPPRYQIHLPRSRRVKSLVEAAEELGFSQREIFAVESSLAFSEPSPDDFQAE